MKFVSVLSSLLLAVAAPAHGEADPPIDPAAMDLSAKPGVDFFQYANGGWIATHPIPPEYSRWGSFIELNERNLSTLREILEACSTPDALAHADPGSPRQKLGLFYASGMDLAQVNAEGAKPLQPYFEQIQKLSDASALARVVAGLHLVDADPLFAFSSSVDERDSSTQIGTFSQSGLGLPDRDYYLKTDEKTVGLRSAYRAHVAKMFALLGDDAGTAGRAADQVLDLETKLAQASKTRVELRDPESNYHKVPAAELEKMSPGF
ncbi:MAG TPA: M13 family metallopeptidase N-terminal domain-containing protein, partial [Chthoniobacterales bacterium]